jgi:phosphatidylglycerophosphatase A
MPATIMTEQPDLPKNDPAPVVRPPRLPRSFGDRLILGIATGLGSGFSPVASGTVGTLWGLPIAWGLSAAGVSGVMLAACCVALLLLAVPLCSRAEKLVGGHDPGCVVLDEIVALQIVFVGTSFSLATAIVGFLAFRLFDVLKPWPVSRLERLPGGWGVVADDAGAAVLAGFCTWGIARALGL